MGMVGCFAAVPSETLQRLRTDPDSIDEYLNPNDGEDEPPDYVEIDKAWHGIHYLLTGRSQGGTEPLLLTIFGGEEFGPENCSFKRTAASALATIVSYAAAVA